MRPRRVGEGEGERVSSSTFSCIPLCHGGHRPLRQTLRPSSSCAHAHTAAAGPGRPASLPSLKEEKKSDRGRRRENDHARSLPCARGVYWVFGDTSSLGIPGIIRATRLRSLRVSRRGCSFPIPNSCNIENLSCSFDYFY